MPFLLRRKRDGLWWKNKPWRYRYKLEDQWTREMSDCKPYTQKGAALNSFTSHVYLSDEETKQVVLSHYVNGIAAHPLVEGDSKYYYNGKAWNCSGCRRETARQRKAKFYAKYELHEVKILLTERS